MRISRAVTALAATGLLVATVADAAGPAAGTTAAAGCTPSWQLVDTPPPPTTPQGAPVLGIFSAGGPPDTELHGATAVSADDVWFPGVSSSGERGLLQPWVLHWDGHSLKPAAEVPEGPFTNRDDASGGSFDSASDGWLVGNSHVLPVAYPQYAARWHDGRWTTVPLPVSPDPANASKAGTPALNAVASVTPNDAWAIGGSHYGLSWIGALTEHWDGDRWSTVANPASAGPGAVLNAISVASADDIWAAGLQQQGDTGVHVPLIEHWDGTAWSVTPVPTGNSPSHLLAVSADSAGDAWAVGAQTMPGTAKTGVILVEHWDGISWHAVTGLPDLGNAELTQVYASGPNDVWATVAAIRSDTHLGVDNFLHWDGTSWTVVPAPGPHEFGVDYEYAGIDGTGPDNVWAAGYSLHPGGNLTTPLIAHLSCG